jgi:hypothetical protein
MPYLIRHVGNLSFYIIETDRPSSNHQERHDRTDEEGDEFRREPGERNKHVDLASVLCKSVPDKKYRTSRWFAIPLCTFPDGLSPKYYDAGHGSASI